MKCRRCNRALKREPWRSQGIGKICSAKEAADRERQNEETGDVIVPYDGGDIWIERLACATGTENGTEYLKHSCSGIRTNVQRTVVRHSPSGFNFGYAGSGPADLALNICRMFTTPEIADMRYQDFKREFLGADGDRLEIKRDDIMRWMADKSAEELAQKLKDNPGGSFYGLLCVSAVIELLTL